MGNYILYLIKTYNGKNLNIYIYTHIYISLCCMHELLQILQQKKYSTPGPSNWTITSIFKFSNMQVLLIKSLPRLLKVSPVIRNKGLLHANMFVGNVIRG